MNELILATSNPGKLAEFQTLLAPIQCISQQTLGIDDADECGLSFIENAIIKARHACTLGKKPALADDSGLVVHALHDEPGIYSARYAGAHAKANDNIDLLLKRLKHVPDEARQAYFYCTIVLMQHAEDPTPLIATGKLSGTICREPQGSHGFGYDPVFYLQDYLCTVAQLSQKIKNQISHRAKALKQLHAHIALIP